MVYNKIDIIKFHAHQLFNHSSRRDPCCMDRRTAHHDGRAYVVSTYSQAAMDAARERDRRRVDGALYSCRDLRTYYLECAIAQREWSAIGDRHTFYFECTREYFLELHVLLSAAHRFRNLDMPIPRSHDRRAHPARCTRFACRRMAPRAICRVGHVRRISQLSGVGDESQGIRLFCGKIPVWPQAQK
jgi:hypothetical protein